MEIIEVDGNTDEAIKKAAEKHGFYDLYELNKKEKLDRRDQLACDRAFRATYKKKKPQPRKVQDLDDSELLDIVHYDDNDFPVMHEEEIDQQEWGWSMRTVFQDKQKNLWVVEWEKGYTEKQEDIILQRPKRCLMREEEVTITKTIIELIENNQ